MQGPVVIFYGIMYMFEGTL